MNFWNSLYNSTKILRTLMLMDLVLVVLTGCAPLGGSVLPTPWPTGYLPTALALTLAVLPTPTQPMPTASTAITLTIVPPTASFTPSPTLSQTPFPLPSSFPSETLVPAFTPGPTSAATIQIITPGPLSRVISPIKLHGYVIPGDDHLVRIELYGEDGSLLARQLLRLYTSGKWAYLAIDIPFEVQAAAELARLQVSTEDQNGRTISLNSVSILLLSAGYAEINPPGNLEERCALNMPASGARISNGILTLRGQMRPFNNQPLIIELVTPTGAVVGSKMIAIQPEPDDSYVPFEAELSYNITSASRVLLTIRQSDDRILGPVYLFSREVYLNP